MKALKSNPWRSSGNFVCKAARYSAEIPAYNYCLRGIAIYVLWGEGLADLVKVRGEVDDQARDCLGEVLPVLETLTLARYPGEVF